MLCEHRTGGYLGIARGFGVAEYKPLLASDKANERRLKTAGLATLLSSPVSRKQHFRQERLRGQECCDCERGSHPPRAAFQLE